jgi:hypothetical protein
VVVARRRPSLVGWGKVLSQTQSEAFKEKGVSLPSFVMS